MFALLSSLDVHERFGSWCQSRPKEVYYTLASPKFVENFATLNKALVAEWSIHRVHLGAKRRPGTERWSLRLSPTIVLAESLMAICVVDHFVFFCGSSCWPSRGAATAASACETYPITRLLARILRRGPMGMKLASLATYEKRCLALAATASLWGTDPAGH
jgi:hypothetical protein